MTIGKKLYTNFGIILTMVLVLFLVNWSAVQREHAAKAAAAASKDLDDATNAVRSQMMQNRLYLSNYLLSGDTREVDRMNEGLRTPEREAGAGQGPGQLRSGQNKSDQGPATGAGVGQGVRATADRKAERRRLRQRHRRRTADLLSSEGRFFLGEEFDRRARHRRRRKPQTDG